MKVGFEKFTPILLILLYKSQQVNLQWQG